MNCSLLGSFVHGILQPRILEWGSLSLLQGIFPTQGWNQVSHIAGGFFTSRATGEAQEYWRGYTKTWLSYLKYCPSDDSSSSIFFPLAFIECLLFTKNDKLLNSCSDICGKDCCHPHFTDEAAEPQRGKLTCPTSLSSGLAEPGPHLDR